MTWLLKTLWLLALEEARQAAAAIPAESSPVATDSGSARSRSSPAPEAEVVTTVTPRWFRSSAQTEKEATERSVLSRATASVTARASPTAELPAEVTTPARQFHERGREDVDVRPELSAYESREVALEEVEYATAFDSSATVESPRTLSSSSSSAVHSTSTTSSPSTTSPSSKLPETAIGNTRKNQPYARSKPSSADGFPDQLNEVRHHQPEANEIDFEPQASATFERRTSPDFEQEGSSSDKVLAYQLRAANLEEPRQQPQFFVPPIVRRPYRRRVSLTGGGRRSNSPSLGDRLAEQVRRQLEQLQRREQAETGYQHPFIPSPPTTTKRPYRPPFIPTPPSTTEKPYQPPFIPTPPSTTEKPYKPPFIPTPPSTTEKPYKPPFIPTPPTTTSRPYQHPFIPSAPTPTPKPYRHPFVPVPPSATERPQPRRVGGDGSRSQATIVHQETLEAGFIVGEYGVVHGSGTVRGVKYAADSSVDRRLLEAALAQFLTL